MSSDQPQGLTAEVIRQLKGSLSYQALANKVGFRVCRKTIINWCLGKTSPTVYDHVNRLLELQEEYRAEERKEL